MTQVILIIHIIIVVSLVGMVLLQRSEGGALGIGGGGGGMMSGRGAANALTRGTSLLAAAFFATSLGLAVFADRGPTAAEQREELTGEETTVIVPGKADADSLLDGFGIEDNTPVAAPAAPETVDDLLDQEASEAEASETPAPESDQQN